ncbi:MAG: M16 family metallopeptidase [bacterium]
MKKFLFLISALLLTIAFTQAGTILDREYRSIFLDNGLEVIMIKSGSEPIVTIEIAVKNGAYTQTPENCGLSHLYEHMFFKGNKKWTSQEDYAKRIRELGIVYNGMTSNEAVRYFFTLPSRNEEEGIEFMAYAIMDPIFDTLELAKEINVVLNEFNRDFSEPSYIFYQLNEEAMFEKFFYRKNAIGDKSVIENATQKQMFEIKDKYYIPNNSALIVVGDIDFNRTEKLVRKYFSKWSRMENPDFDFPEHPELESIKKVFTVQNVSATDLMLTFRGPDVGKNNEKTYAIDLLCEIMKLKSLPLYTKLVNEGIAYDYYLGYYTQRDGATVTFYSSSPAENALRVKDIFFEELNQIYQSDFLTDEILNQAKERAEMNFYQDIESSVDFALGVGFWWCVSDIDYFQNYLQNLKKVNIEDIKSVMKEYLINKPYVEGIMTDEKSAKEIFSSKGEIK